MIQALCELDSAVNTPRAPVAAQVLPLRVRDVMSVSPVTIPPSRSVQEAHTLMQQRKVRHLPVLNDGSLVGIVSDRDIRLVLPSPATSLSGHDIGHLAPRVHVG